jgi:hypothetical protein
MKRNGLEQTRNLIRCAKCTIGVPYHSIHHKALKGVCTLAHLHTTFFKKNKNKNNMVETLCKHFLVDNLWDSMLGFLYNNGGEVMIQELNQQLKSMYLEPRNKFRVDVDYVIGRIEEIIYSDRQEATLGLDMEEFLIELKQNNKNHKENHNGN